MKTSSIFTALAMSSILFVSCGNGSDKSASDDSVTEAPVGPAPDNSNATNPSYPDSAKIVDSAH